MNLAVLTALAEATTEAAILVSMAARITGGATPASIVQLIKEVQMSLMLSKLKIAGSLLFVSLFMAGIASMAQPQTPCAPLCAPPSRKSSTWNVHGATPSSVATPGS